MLFFFMYEINEIVSVGFVLIFSLLWGANKYNIFEVHHSLHLIFYSCTVRTPWLNSKLASSRATGGNFVPVVVDVCAAVCCRALQRGERCRRCRGAWGMRSKRENHHPMTRRWRGPKIKGLSQKRPEPRHLLSLSAHWFLDFGRWTFRIDFYPDFISTATYYS